MLTLLARLVRFTFRELLDRLLRLNELLDRLLRLNEAVLSPDPTPLFRPVRPNALVPLIRAALLIGARVPRP